MKEYIKDILFTISIFLFMWVIGNIADYVLYEGNGLLLISCMSFSLIIYLLSKNNKYINARRLSK